MDDLSRVPGMRSTPKLRAGDEARGDVCEDCLMPKCPGCGCCMTPVWPMPMTFQCDCGYSASMIDAGSPELAEAYASLWSRDLDPFDLAHDLGIDPFRGGDVRHH